MENNEIYIEERLRNENLKIYMENDNIINIKLLQGSLICLDRNKVQR